MSEELRLRDHSHACEHGYRYTHIYAERVERPDLGGAFVRSETCPGGKEIVLRVEVAGKVTYYEGEVVEE